MSEWKSQIASVKWVIVEMDTGVPSDAIKLIGELFEALTADDIRLTLDMRGEVSVDDLPFDRIKIGWLDLDGDRGWTGNPIYGAWFRSTKSRPSLLPLGDISPQLADAAARQRFRPLLISNRVALVTSHVHGHFLKAKVLSATAAGWLVGFLGERDHAFDDIDIDAEEGLFDQAWTYELRSRFMRGQPFSVHDTNERNRDANHIAFTNGVMSAYFSDGQEHPLLSGCHTVHLTLNDAYAGRGNAAAVRFARSLAPRHDLRHLWCDDRVGVLEKMMRLRKKSRDDRISGGLTNLATVVAYLYDARRAADVAMLDTIDDIKVEHYASESGTKAKSFVKKMEAMAVWASASCKENAPMKCIRYVHGERQAKRLAREGAAAAR